MRSENFYKCHNIWCHNIWGDNIWCHNIWGDNIWCYNIWKIQVINKNSLRDSNTIPTLWKYTSLPLDYKYILCTFFVCCIVPVWLIFSFKSRNLWGCSFWVRLDLLSRDLKRKEKKIKKGKRKEKKKSGKNKIGGRVPTLPQ